MNSRKVRYIIASMLSSVLLLSLGGCDRSNLYEIRGEMGFKHQPYGGWVYLYRDCEKEPMDSAQVKFGTFSFTGECTSQLSWQLMYLSNRHDPATPILVEPGVVEVDMALARAQGAPLNDALSQFYALLDSINRTYAGYLLALKREPIDDHSSSRLDSLYDAMMGATTEVASQYLEAHRSDVIGAIALAEIIHCADSHLPIDLDSLTQAQPTQLRLHPMVRRAKLHYIMRLKAPSPH